MERDLMVMIENLTREIQNLSRLQQASNLIALSQQLDIPLELRQQYLRAATADMGLGSQLADQFKGTRADAAIDDPFNLDSTKTR